MNGTCWRPNNDTATTASSRDFTANGNPGRRHRNAGDGHESPGLPAGDGGFGYDPIFYGPELNATAAQLAAEVKNRVSHRGRALLQLRVALKEHLEGSARSNG